MQKSILFLCPSNSPKWFWTCPKKFGAYQNFLDTGQKAKLYIPKTSAEE